MNEEKDVRICPVCEKEVDRADMQFTKDCHGITFRLVCYDCYSRLMAKGYDGEYYDERDEQIEAEVDRILRKIRATGEGSLTDTERETLVYASREYQRRQKGG